MKIPIQFAFYSQKTQSTALAAIGRVFATTTGTINVLDIWAVFAPSGNITLNLSVNGVKAFSGAGRPVLASGSNHVQKTGLAIAVTKGDLISIDAEIVTIGGFFAPLFFQVEIDDGATIYTTEIIQDLVAAFLVAGTNVTLTYDDAGGTLTIASSGGGGGGSSYIDETIAVTDETSVIATATAKITFHVRRSFTLSGLIGGLTVPSSSGALTINVKKNGSSIFTTNKLTIDAGEATSLTAATAANITTTSFSAGDEITVDIDAAGTGAKGLKLYFLGS